VKRAYLLKGPTQPIVNFPKMGSRGFSKVWYHKYDWIGYSDLMVCYIKREIFRKLDSDVINKPFQGMRTRNGHLPKRPRAT
jgi:hypothetical protein